MKSFVKDYLCRQKIKESKMFWVISFMLSGIVTGYIFRRHKFRFIQRLILTLIWALLFLLGLELGSNHQIISQIGSLGIEAFILAGAATLGSVFFSWLLWIGIKEKSSDK